MEQRWRDPEFVRGAHAWIDATLAGLGRARTGEVEQPHVREWSTVMRVPTSDGDLWFKANHDALVHEAAVLELLTVRAPDRVPGLVAIERESGWMLMTDAGQRLREIVETERSLRRWLDVLDACARIQIACEGDVEALLSLGVPDLRLHRLPGAYAAVLDEVTDLDPRLPPPGRIAELCDELAAFGIAETIEHDDLHDGQVFAPAGAAPAEHLITDWGDVCVSHPFFTLAVTLEGVIAWGVDDVEGSEDLGPYLDAYLAPYRAHHPGLSDEELRTAARLAMRLGWVCRAVNGRLVEEPSATRTRLTMFLDGRP
jgi:hypothetical protein